MILGLSVYVAVILFFGLSVYQAIKYAKMPLHARMELYPVPSEKGRHQYGGSYMEEPEWWRKPRQVSKVSELVDMMKEMLLIKKLFDNQRSLWWISYAFHLGIYFLIAWFFLLIIGAITEFAGASVAEHAWWWPALAYYLTLFCGAVGFVLTTVGVALLLIRRITDSVLRKYTTPQEYFNLVLLLATLISGIIVVWSPDWNFNIARQLTEQALTFSVVPNTALVIHIVLLVFTLIYIPLSKMGHYVGKYFTYHKILWENEPNIPGSPMEAKVKEALENKPTTSWAESQIQSSASPQES